MTTPQERFKAIMAGIQFPIEMPDISHLATIEVKNRTAIIRSYAPLGTSELQEYICNQTQSRDWIMELECPTREKGEYTWKFVLPK